MIPRWARIALVLAVLLIAGWRFWPHRPPVEHSPAAALTRTTASIGADATLDSFAVSRDGSRLAYASEDASGQLHLFVRDIRRDRMSAIAGTDGAHNPFFAPDGHAIAFFAHDAIWRVEISASRPVKICDAAPDDAGGAWLEDGRIVFAPLQNSGLMVVPSSGGVPSPLTSLDRTRRELAHGWPHALPGGAVLFTVAERNRDPHLEVVTAGGARGGRLVPAIGQAQLVRNDRLIYSYLGSLYTVGFDVDGMKIVGTPAIFAKGVRTDTGFDQLGRAAFAAGSDGTLAWMPATPSDGHSALVKVSLDGAVEPVEAPTAVYETPRISPDGRRLAVAVRSALLTRDLRVLDLAKPGTPQQEITGGDNQSPAWTPDGELSYASNRDGTQRIFVGTEPLFGGDETPPRNPASWSRSPRLLAMYEIDPDRGRDILIYRPGSGITPVVATPANERAPALSPDGLSLAYVSDASGRDEIYVKKLSEPSIPARQVTNGGGVEPVWMGDQLLYRRGDRMMRDGRTLFEGRFVKDAGANAAAFDADPRGRFLIMLRPAAPAQEIRIISPAFPARAGSTGAR